MGIVWTNASPMSKSLKRTVSQQFSLGPITVKLLAVLVVALLSIFYLFQSNASATKAYLIKELEQKKEDLMAQNEKLEYEAERLKSLSAVETSAKEQGLVEVGNIDARVSE